MIEKKVFKNKQENSITYVKNAVFENFPVCSLDSEKSMALSNTTIFSSHNKERRYFTCQKVLKIFYPEKGNFLFYMDGNIHSIFPDEYALFNIGVKHGTGIPKFEDRISKLKIIAFSMDVFEDVLKEQNIKIPLEGLILDTPVKTKMPLLKSIIRTLFQGAEDKFFENELFLDLILRELALYLLNIHKGNYKKLVIDSRKDGRIKKAVEFIKDNYARKFPLEELAKESGLSKERLTQLLKKETGKTPWQFLNAYRVDKAKELLKNPNKTIKNVCNEIGLKDMSYFGEIFFKYTSMTPLDFRKQISK